MSYNGEESSRKSGSPVELYDINLGSDSWHFTSSEDTITMDAIDYEPMPVHRESFPIGREENKPETPITLPASHPFVRKFIQLVPSEIASVSLRRYHRFDLTTEVISLFTGYVTGVKFSDDGLTATIGVAPFTANMSRPVPRYVYSGLCNHVLGDRWCNADGTVDLATDSSPGGKAFKYVGNLSAFTTPTRITVDGVSSTYPDNFFQSGRVVTAAGDTRLITHQIGNSCYLYVPLFEGAALIGNNVTLFAGCDHTVPTCKDKFGNVINFGGFPFVPLNNPFNTGLT
jgi:uncharacterized phage protein (TIGR02218 family)